MARIRTVKPDYFFDEHLALLPLEDRLSFIGLWLHADRAGRLEDRPQYLKAQLWPYEDRDMAAILGRLAGDNPAGKTFIRRYAVAGKPYIQILNFGKHQRPHHTEKSSEIPADRKSTRLNSSHIPLSRMPSSA